MIVAILIIIIARRFRHYICLCRTSYIAKSLGIIHHVFVFVTINRVFLYALTI